MMFKAVLRPAVNRRVRKNTEWRSDRSFGYAIINSLNGYCAVVKIGPKGARWQLWLWFTTICTYNAPQIGRIQMA